MLDSLQDIDDNEETNDIVIHYRNHNHKEPIDSFTKVLVTLHNLKFTPPSNFPTISSDCLINLKLVILNFDEKMKIQFD
jgi:hypothetical protein